MSLGCVKRQLHDVYVEKKNDYHDKCQLLEPLIYKAAWSSKVLPMEKPGFSLYRDGGSYTSIEILAWKIEIEFRNINETVYQPSGQLIQLLDP